MKKSFYQLPLKALLMLSLAFFAVSCGDDDDAKETTTISIASNSARISMGETHQFNATVSGNSNTNVLWTVESGEGTITNSGLYSAPISISQDSITILLKATSEADASIFEFASVTVLKVESVVVSITPAEVNLFESGEQHFVANVANATDESVTWTIESGEGTISSMGHFTAPEIISMDSIETVVKATSVEDTQAFATALVKITKEPLVIDTAFNVQADTAQLEIFTFFNLKDNAVVTDTNGTNWDLSFKGTTIITNSGISGSGEGGAIVLTGTTFEDYEEAPAMDYAIDDSSSFAIPTGSGNGWYNYNFMNNSITPIPGVVLIIRTGDGKFAKVEILSYYKDVIDPAEIDPNVGFRNYTFRFVYQKDGSRKLK